MKTDTTPDSREQQDLAHNPSQEYYDQKFNEMTSGYSSSADDLKELEDHANQGAGEDSAKGDKGDKESSPTDNIDQAKSQEESGAGWVNKFDNDPGNQGPKSNRFKINLLKKKGPIGLIAAALFGGGATFTVMFSPGMALVSMKEALMDSG